MEVAMVVTRTGVHTTSGLLTADFASGSHLLRPQFFGEGIVKEAAFLATAQHGTVLHD
jgi:hypothetical protein